MQTKVRAEVKLLKMALRFGLFFGLGLRRNKSPAFSRYINKRGTRVVQQLSIFLAFIRQELIVVSIVSHLRMNLECN